MVTSAPISTSIGYDEILSTLGPIPTDDGEKFIEIKFDSTTYLIFIFPLYICAIILNFLSIYSILIAKIYRQYLSNVLLAVICIGALINIHGQMFLILLRWTDNSLSNRLCSSSLYLRDSGSMLIHMHVFLLASERILANIKKHPTNLNNNLIQRAHLFLISMSLISIILSLTVPIYTLKHSSFSTTDGLCIPIDTKPYQNYIICISYGFGHPFVWLSCILLGLFLLRRTTISYSTLIPMNRIILTISLISCINLLITTLLDDIIGISGQRTLESTGIDSTKMFYLMNIRDLISIVHKILIGLVFFLFRPEIRLWLYEAMKNFQSDKKENITPQMLDIRNELDETDDGNLHFRADN